MKFTLPNPGHDAKHEYEMYTYLYAINNTEIEAYGIPSVHYYGRWDGCILIAIILLDPDFNERCIARDVSEVDILIMSREYVSKSLVLHRQIYWIVVYLRWEYRNTFIAVEFVKTIFILEIWCSVADKDSLLVCWNYTSTCHFCLFLLNHNISRWI